MDFETTRRLDCGRMPPDWYSVANTQDELASVIEKLGSGFVIHDDLPFGSSFGFVRDGDDVVFFTDEFKDEGGEIENPDFHVRRFHSITDGVAGFKVNGRPISEVGLGCRIAQYDIPPGWPLIEAA